MNKEKIDIDIDNVDEASDNANLYSQDSNFRGINFFPVSNPQEAIQPTRGKSSQSRGQPISNPTSNYSNYPNLLFPSFDNGNVTSASASAPTPSTTLQYNATIIIQTMPKLSLLDELMFAKAQGHAERQQQREGKTRFSSVIHGHTQYFRQKNNLMTSLADHTQKSSDLLAESWLRLEAEASLVPTLYQDNFSTQTAVIGAFDVGSSFSSQTQTSFNALYQAWRIAAIAAIKVLAQKQSRISSPDASFATDPKHPETLFIFPSESSLMEKITSQIALLERQRQRQRERERESNASLPLPPSGGLIVDLFNYARAEKSDINHSTSIALLSALQVASEKKLEVSANDWLILASQAESFGAFKDKKTKALFDEAEATWRKGAITKIQETIIKDHYSIERNKSLKLGA